MKENDAYVFTVSPQSLRSVRVPTSGTVEKMYPGIVDSINRLFPESTGFTAPELYFSDAEPEVRQFGDLSWDDICKKLRKMSEEYRGIPGTADILVPLLNGNDNRSFHPWLPPDAQEGLSSQAKELIQKVKDLLGREHCSIVVAGQYDQNSNRVTIYSKAFEKMEEPEKSAQIRRTVAHEVFHALHKHLSPKTYAEKTYYAEIVREALADFYSYIYCLNPIATRTDGVQTNASINAAYSRDSFWRKYLFVNLPYPNAIFHMYRNEQINFDNSYDDCMKEGDFRKLREILETGKVDMKQAYQDLVPEPFRKDPPKEHLAEVRKEERHTRRGVLQVDDIGFSDGAFSMTVWEILKRIVKDRNISSLEELQELIPPSIIRFVRGRFLVLESGEILAAYPQWKIVSESKFKRFAAGLGYMDSFYTVIEVISNDGEAHFWRFETDDTDSGEDVMVGDYVKSQVLRGYPVYGTVQKVIEMTQKEYQEQCKRIGCDELPAAQKTHRRTRKAT